MAASGDRYDLIIVGGGIMGSCAAYEAAKRGRRVLLLEQFDFLHHLGSSHGESRTTRVTYPEPYYPPLVLAAGRLWDAAQAEIGFSVLTPTPHLDFGPADNKALRAVLDASPSARILAPGDAISAAFRIPEDWIGVGSDHGGVIKPTKAVSMFQTLALKRGAILKDRIQVTEIKKNYDGNGGILVFTAGGDCFFGAKCVVSAGAWMRKLVKQVSGIDLPIQPLHTTICYWKIKEGYERELSVEGGFPTFASYGDAYVYGTPAMEFPGLIKIALHGGRPCDPDNRDWEANSGVLVDAVGEWIEQVLPGKVESEKPLIVQSCMYSMTPDGDFVIDFLGGEFGKDVVVAGGFSGHGFKMGPIVGQILADLALDGAAQRVEMEHFRLGRFAEDANGNTKEFEEPVSSHAHPCKGTFH